MRIVILKRGHVTDEITVEFVHYEISYEVSHGLVIEYFFFRN